MDSGPKQAGSFVELVDGGADVGDLVGFAQHVGDAGEDLPVVDLDDDVDAEFLEDFGGDLHQFGLVEQGVGADDVGVALVELAVAAFLGTVGAPHGLHLVPLEREGDLALVLDHIAGEWHR